VVYHPSGVRFRKDGPADWPDDAYTTRRIADGDVTTEAPPPQHKKEKAGRAPEKHDS
jgi:hypothetical protein